jgi:hypothetical protein
MLARRRKKKDEEDGRTVAEEIPLPSLPRVATAQVYHIPVTGASSDYVLRVVDNTTHLALAQAQARVWHVSMISGPISFLRTPNTTNMEELAATWRRLNDRREDEYPRFDEFAWLLALGSAPSFDAFVSLPVLNLEKYRGRIEDFFTRRKRMTEGTFIDLVDDEEEEEEEGACL